MRKLVFGVLCLFISSILLAQDSTKAVPKKKPVIDLSGRANDHLMFQIGSLGWSGKPDSIKTKGLSKSVNIYMMFDFPVKTNPKMSIGFGAGFGTDHMYFDKMYLGIKDQTNKLTIDDRSDTVNYFKKYKLAVAWLEAPIELRYTKDPLNSNKSFKVALGVKVGTLFNAHTRATDFVDASGTNPYTEKIASKRFFNKNRLSVTARFGVGVFSLFGSYQVTQLFKENLAPKINPWTIGLQLSGL